MSFMTDHERLSSERRLLPFIRHKRGRCQTFSFRYPFSLVLAYCIRKEALRLSVLGMDFVSKKTITRLKASEQHEGPAWGYK